MAGLALVTGMAINAQSQTYVATLAGKDAKPPTSSTAIGTATVTAKEGVLTYKLDVGAVNEVTSACLHVEGDKPAVVMLYNGPKTGKMTGTLASGTVKPEELNGITSDELATALRTGKAYVSVHTVKYPGGEISGKLVPPAAGAKRGS